ncbi:MAG: aminomethyl-transferring glycine dehydrogenase [Ignavibacteriaceae bacterium]|nr:aminomethyl-transferring glycine dehydrogenase [Ignavibacteriaceae bacterium]
MNQYNHPDKFRARHIGPSQTEIVEMIKQIGVSSLDELIDQTIPHQIRLKKDLQLSEPLTEYEFINYFKEIASKNKVYKSYIGMGYYPTILPPVIKRNILENPGWYTQYTPYQAEIAQGRLEALLNFQTMVIDLTGLEIANASLLDEGTAAAEAVQMLYGLRTAGKKNSKTIFISEEVFPHTIDIIRTRATLQGINIVIGDHRTFKLNDDVFAVLVQYPSGLGEVYDYREFFRSAEEKNIFKIVAADLLSLTLLTPPGEFGADVVVGSSQRFGVPMGFGGPHAAFFATKDEYKRLIPGRIIGVSIDVHNNPAYRMALQTREQHIRREKATSNICTAQVLLAVIAGMYSVYHGPKGLKNIAERIHRLTKLLDSSLKHLNIRQVNQNYFDTLHLVFDSADVVKTIRINALEKKINLRYISEKEIGISLSEPDDLKNVKELISVFEYAVGKKITDADFNSFAQNIKIEFPEFLSRKTEYMLHPVFNSYQSETDLLRYMKRLENKDLSLAHSMIPLGSCTMKLNATVEMEPVTWPELGNMHPFVPTDQAAGYLELTKQLEADLCEITGFKGVSLQPNSGAQGEFTGLLVIRNYHNSRGDVNRNIVLIPSSAHGTNPASAVMAGMKVVVVNCDSLGNVDITDLRNKAELNKADLAALMITYPSTHGVFEEKIIEICDIVHSYGGLVYMDGANMNAQVGLTSPAVIGADVCHLNLHKTFCIPHGGGGPGVGPIAVNEKLVKFLPGHSVIKLDQREITTAVSSAPYGSAGILVISYAYIKMMGSKGLTDATKVAILNANYIKSRLENSFKVLYSGESGRVGHELIFDMREFKHSANIEVEDIAKRLMDYGFHAPTVSFPVAGTFMVEPTESESKAELDRFCDSLLMIRDEIKEIEEGRADVNDNTLKNAPHTIQVVTKNEWNHSYSREKAAFPAPWLYTNKFWPITGRINSAYGDRHLVCSCNPVTDYVEEPVS